VFRVRVSNTRTLLPEFLFLYWFSKEGRAELETSVAGSAQGGISLERLDRVRIVVPDPRVQVRFIRAARKANVEQGYSFMDLLGSVLPSDDTLPVK
jgi:hypothetical protein